MLPSHRDFPHRRPITTLLTVAPKIRQAEKTKLNLLIPEHVKLIREKVLRFVDGEVCPVENQVDSDHSAEKCGDTSHKLMQKAKDQGLWALGRPIEIGGGGLPLMDYVFVIEVVGRSGAAIGALGNHSLQDFITLHSTRATSGVRSTCNRCCR